jgi:hypothetical protein
MRKDKDRSDVVSSIPADAPATREGYIALFEVSSGPCTAVSLTDHENTATVQ